MNGTNIPETIMELSRRKTITVFVDGDRGGDLIIKELGDVAEIDFVTKAPDGKEVEELTKKEIHKAIRARVAYEQASAEVQTAGRNGEDRRHQQQRGQQQQQHRPMQQQQPRQDSRNDQRNERQEQRAEPRPVPAGKPKDATPQELESFSEMLEDLIGTRGAYILDDKLNILGKVPLSELQGTLKSMKSGIYAVVFDGIVEKDLLETASRANVSFLVAMDSKVKSTGRPGILTSDDL
jgi:DNA primase